MQEAKGKDIHVTFSARYNQSEWKRWEYQWHVSNDPIDPYLTYRLIEPDYEIFNNQNYVNVAWRISMNEHSYLILRLAIDV